MRDTWTDLATPLFSLVDFALDAPLSAGLIAGVIAIAFFVVS